MSQSHQKQRVCARRELPGSTVDQVKGILQGNNHTAAASAQNSPGREATCLQRRVQSARVIYHWAARTTWLLSTFQRPDANGHVQFLAMAIHCSRHAHIRACNCFYAPEPLAAGPLMDAGGAESRYSYVAQRTISTQRKSATRGFIREQSRSQWSPEVGLVGPTQHAASPFVDAATVILRELIQPHDSGRRFPPQELATGERRASSTVIV